MRTGVWEGGRAGGKAGGQQAGRPQAPQANWLLAWSSKDPHKTFTAYTASGPCGKAAHRDAAEGGLDVGGVGRRLGSSRDGGGGSTHHLRAWCKYETSAPRSMLQKAAACLLSEAPPPLATLPAAVQGGGAAACPPWTTAGCPHLVLLPSGGGRGGLLHAASLQLARQLLQSLHVASRVKPGVAKGKRTSSAGLATLS